MSQQSTRATFSGTCQSLAKVLNRFAERPDFLREPGKIESRKDKQNRILGSKKLIRELRELQDNLSFGLVKVQRALKEVHAEASWKASVPDGEAWSKAVAKLLCKNLRCVSQAEGKTALWTMKLKASMLETSLRAGKQRCQLQLWSLNLRVKISMEGPRQR